MRTELRLAAVLAALVVPVAHAADALKPGLWQVTSRTEMPGMAMPQMPDIPPEDLARMKQMGIQMPEMGGGQEVTVKHCLTKEDAQRGMPAQGKDADRCEVTDFRRQGSTASWKMACKGNPPASGRGSVTYGGSESYSGAATIDTVGPDGRTMTIKNAFRGKWLSANCP